MAQDSSLTPIRRQYLELKARHPDAILFFRLGDFYETFDADAELVARELDIVLTSRPLGRGGRIPMAGVPYHAVDSYLTRLIARGYRVAICEQLADPKDVKGIVPRGIVRVVSPGTVTEPDQLEAKRNNYLASHVPPDPAAGLQHAGIAYVDITTGEFCTTQIAPQEVQLELERLAPAEIIVPSSSQDSASSSLPSSPSRASGNERRGASPTLASVGETGPAAATAPVSLRSSGSAATITPCDPRWFDPERGRLTLQQHFDVATLAAFGCQDQPAAIAAAAAIVEYLRDSQPAVLAGLTRLATYSTTGFMQIDPQTRRNLELSSRARDASARGSLLSVLDLTHSPMGGRLLRRWLDQPLVDLEPLQQRLDGVEWFFRRTLARGAVNRALSGMPDLERLVNRVRGGRAGPRDLLALLRGLQLLPDLQAAVEPGDDDELPGNLAAGLEGAAGLRDLITAAISDDAPAALDQGEVIRPGFSPELDRLRQIVAQGQAGILALEQKERDATGIRSLKVGYNRVFGYYFEVSNAHHRLVPSSYIRKQTLVGAERFYTPELKERETALLSAQEQIGSLEQDLFRQVCAQVACSAEHVLDAAAAVARIDCHAALAEAAVRYGYVRPRLNLGDTIEIIGGRHPVVERFVDAPFVPNDTLLSNSGCQIAVITGPNMSGKSTYLRQVALITLLAQIGSFVPADAATVGLVDRIFSRIGAQDDLASGESTFMVEMVETAHILHHATARSLVILDELGRGTSTYDGISIAQAVVEFLHNESNVTPKTLFATHYHELTALSGYLPRVKNFTFAVTEEGGRLAFLRRIVPGNADRSYGIHVARLAGMPVAVTRRADEVLAGLEQGQRKEVQPSRNHRRVQDAMVQLPLFGGDEVTEELRNLDINAMTPLEALTTLYQLQQKARGPRPAGPAYPARR